MAVKNKRTTGRGQTKKPKLKRETICAGASGGGDLDRAGWDRMVLVSTPDLR